MGWLSDRTGRKVFLRLGYLAGIASLAILAVSTSVWHFCIVLVLHAISVGANATVGGAWVTDLLPHESLGGGPSLFSAANWIGGILGFAGAGYALQTFGPLPTFILRMGLLVMTTSRWTSL